MSTCCYNIQYDAETEILVVEFPGIGGKGGKGVWEYYNVPPLEAAGLITSSSQGSYFNNYIKGQYSYSQISGFEQQERNYLNSF